MQNYANRLILACIAVNRHACEVRGRSKLFYLCPLFPLAIHINNRLHLVPLQSGVYNNNGLEKVKKLYGMLLFGVVALSVAGCSSSYVMSTKTGEMIVTKGKPELDKQTGLTRYYDEQGVEHQIQNEQVVQMIKRG